MAISEFDSVFLGQLDSFPHFRITPFMAPFSLLWGPPSFPLPLGWSWNIWVEFWWVDLDPDPATLTRSPSSALSHPFLVGRVPLLK